MGVVKGGPARNSLSKNDGVAGLRQRIMAYDSIDNLQKALAEGIFSYASDRKKASGRALGTLVEIVTYHLLKAWGLGHSIVIERRLPEYANPTITHNVEFSLHPRLASADATLPLDQLPITSKKLSRVASTFPFLQLPIKSNTLLTRTGILRNSCIIHEDDHSIIVANIDGRQSKGGHSVTLYKLHAHPFAVIECKRVGVEEGNKKGPQSIEKAKQGAYVARTVSSLQRFRKADGSISGVFEQRNGTLREGDYFELLKEIVTSNDPFLLSRFIMTIGVVSNHGNWFTSDDHNKELKVLAQSYDWLLFLTDPGLSEFVQSLLMDGSSAAPAVKEAFRLSYTGVSGTNQFTKVRMHRQADIELQSFVRNNVKRVEKWFNVISPQGNSIGELRVEIDQLRDKNWTEILK